MDWVDPWVVLGWVEIFQFLEGWVGSTVAKVLKFEGIIVNAFKVRLDKMWLHQAVTFLFYGQSGRYRKPITRSNKVILCIKIRHY